MSITIGVPYIQYPAITRLIVFQHIVHWAHEYLSEFRAELSAEMSKTGPSEASIAQIRARRRPRNLPNERDSASKKRAQLIRWDRRSERKTSSIWDDAQYALLEPIFSERHERTLAAKADASLSPRDRV